MPDLQQALEWHKDGQLDHAEKAYREILDVDPSNADANNLYGLLLSSKGQEDNACELFQKAVSLNEGNVDYLLNLADSLARTHRFGQATKTFEKAIALAPESSNANARYGLALAQAGVWPSAERFMKRSVDLKDDDTVLWLNYGNVLRKLGRMEEAISAFERSLKLDPQGANSMNSLAESLLAIGEKEKAIEWFRRALQMRPDCAAYLENLGLALHSRGNVSEALENLDRARFLSPDNPAILSNLGAVCRDSCRIEEAMLHFRKAMASGSEDSTIVSKYLYSLNFHPNMERDVVEQEHARLAACFETVRPGARRKRAHDASALNVAFLSGDFGAHSVSYFLLHLIEGSSKSSRLRFFCYGENVLTDSIGVRFMKAATRWRTTVGIPAEEICRWLEEDKIDVLIDLAGHTAGSRLDVVAKSSAPVTLNWLGYPNRVGLNRYDGRVIDLNSDPIENDTSGVGEHLYRMDGCFLAYESPYNLPHVVDTPAKRKGNVTFGSFNNAAKINDRVIRLWARILLECPGSRLLLKSWQFEDQALCRSLRQRFAENGLDAERIEFLPRADSYQDHMACYGELDIALDTFPYNGTTTSCEALWMGAPVITLEGGRHASRVGASLLRAAGLGSYVANTEDSYIELALDLASDVDALSKRRLNRRREMEASELGDVKGFALRFEELLFRIVGEGSESEAGMNERIETATHLHKNGELEKAIHLYEEILEVEPENGTVLHAAGVAQYAVGNYNRSASLLERACVQLGQQADAYSHLGSALQSLGRLDESMAAHEKALEIDPSSSVILSNYGNALVNAGRAGDAIRVFKRSLNTCPDSSATWTNYSLALKADGQIVAALDAARESAKRNPEFSGGLSNLGSMLVATGEVDEAIAVLKKSVDLEPQNHWAWSNLIYALQYSDSMSNEELRDAVLAFGRVVEGSRRPSRMLPLSNRTRIGFVSADFREHAVARFLKPLLRESSGYPVEIFLYHDAPVSDEWTLSLKEASHGWRDIHGCADSQVADWISQDQIAFLIDLGGHSSRNRLTMFALKPAPVQATWLGFPGSTGLRAMDYRIADAIALTEEEISLYPENGLLLPDGFHTIEFPDAPDIVETPSLANDVFSFGSFNNLSKVGPRVLDLWSEILSKAPEAELVLKSYQLRDEAFKELLFEKFEKRGVSRRRIRLLDPVPGYAAHLEAYREVDLCLDPFPYNGTTTSCEALAMGVPIVSLLGDRLCGRVGASLLTEMGLDAFVCESKEEYVDTAVSWVGKAEELNVLRQRLRKELMHSSLGNAKRFAGPFFDAIKSTYEKEREKRIEVQSQLTGWVEKIEFNLGVTDGNVEYARFPEFDELDLTGKRILDASCVDGYWTLKALRAGAREIVCLPAEGFCELGQTGLVMSRQAFFERARSLEGVGDERMRLEPLQIYSVNAEDLGTFNWVLLMVNMNQLRHLVFALDCLRSVCSEGFALSMVVSDEEVLEENGLATLRMREGPFWLPTKEALAMMLATSGFELTSLRFHPLGEGQSIAMAIARPVS